MDTNNTFDPSPDNNVTDDDELSLLMCYECSPSPSNNFCLDSVNTDGSLSVNDDAEIPREITPIAAVNERVVVECTGGFCLKFSIDMLVDGRASRLQGHACIDKQMLKRRPELWNLNGQCFSDHLRFTFFQHMAIYAKLSHGLPVSSPAESTTQTEKTMETTSDKNNAMLYSQLLTSIQLLSSSPSDVPSSSNNNNFKRSHFLSANSTTTLPGHRHRNEIGDAVANLLAETGVFESAMRSMSASMWLADSSSSHSHVQQQQQQQHQYNTHTPLTLAAVNADHVTAMVMCGCNEKMLCNRGAVTALSLVLKTSPASVIMITIFCWVFGITYFQ